MPDMNTRQGWARFSSGRSFQREDSLQVLFGVVLRGTIKPTTVVDRRRPGNTHSLLGLAQSEAESGSFLNHPLRVIGEQVPLPHQRCRGPSELVDVIVVIAIALLDRRTRVAGSDALGLRPGKRQVRAVEQTVLVLGVSRGPDIPPGVRRNRDFERRKSDSSARVAIIVH